MEERILSNVIQFGFEDLIVVFVEHLWKQTLLMSAICHRFSLDGLFDQ